MDNLLIRIFARLVGLAATLLGTWLYATHVTIQAYSTGILVMVLTAGALGALGGILFVLSFDGPIRFRSRKVRLFGWLGMLGVGLQPWIFWIYVPEPGLVVLPLVLLAGATLFRRVSQDDPEQAASA